MEEVFFSIGRDIKQRLSESDSKTEVHRYSLPLHYSFFSMDDWSYQFIHTFSLCMNMFCDLFVQPQAIRINQSDQAGTAGQGAQKSSCCGSWVESDTVFLVSLVFAGMKIWSLLTSFTIYEPLDGKLGVSKGFFYFIFWNLLSQLNSLCSFVWSLFFVIYVLLGFHILFFFNHEIVGFWFDVGGERKI